MNTKRKIIPYNPNLKLLARKLRNNSTLSEILLWQELKGKQLMGYDFHRQKPLDKYIVDFFCNELMLVIEIDGDSHQIDEVYDKDIIRQSKLESLGVHFLRFDDLDVKKDMANVLRAIENWIEEFEQEHTPSPSQEGNPINSTTHLYPNNR
ncbi:MAG: endonuclease domain-containing protein [Bacteroidia bacterium]|nr:endonuclease domain-containing protein [Bacteroidia bacterium]